MLTLRTKIFVALALFLLVMTGVLALIRQRAAGANRQERVRAAEAQAAIIAAHREAQRREAAAPVPEASDTGVPVATATPETAAAIAPRPAVKPYWTDFRGPARDGHYRERAVLTEWPSSGIRPLWKQPIGGGHASFVIAAGRAFTIEQRGPNEVVAAYDVMTGRELWTHGWPAMFSEHFGGDGPRATPVWYEGTLFALGAAGELRAIDAAGESSGRMRWRTNILDDARTSNLPWGMAASPLVAGPYLIVVPGGGGGRSVAAYDRGTGRRAWSALDDDAAYSSPMLATIGGREQILVFAASRLVAITPDRGQLLWEFPWSTQSGIHVAQPLVIDGTRVFISSGYGTGAALIEISQNRDAFAVREIWRTNRMKNQFTSSVYHDGFIYGMDEAILACLDAATGELKWKGGRYGHGQTLLASGHLIVTTDDGDVVLVRASPERHHELARFSAVDGRTWNHPAIADGILLIRNANEMAAFDLRAGQ